MKYRDLVIDYNGKHFLINSYLLARQDASDNLAEIREAHRLKQMIYDMIVETNSPNLIKSLAKDLTEIEYYLQTLWKFSEDAKYHRFWETPKCTCPELDNVDSYPFMQYIRNDCPLHGAE